MISQLEIFDGLTVTCDEQTETGDGRKLLMVWLRQLIVKMQLLQHCWRYGREEIYNNIIAAANDQVGVIND